MSFSPSLEMERKTVLVLKFGVNEQRAILDLSPLLLGLWVSGESKRKSLI